jgi:hypothetical protein
MGVNDWMLAIERMRKARDGDKFAPKLALRRRLRSASKIEEYERLRRDPTLGVWVDRASKLLKRRRRTFAAVRAAWAETVEPTARRLQVDVCLADIKRQTLIVVVPNKAQQYLLDRELASGLHRHFVSSCRASIADVQTRVGKLPATLVRQSRRTRTIDEELEEILAHLDAGVITQEHADQLQAEWNRATDEALRRDAVEG